jgi:hypothetical protein
VVVAVSGCWMARARLAAGWSVSVEEWWIRTRGTGSTKCGGTTQCGKGDGGGGGEWDARVCDRIVAETGSGRGGGSCGLSSAPGGGGGRFGVGEDDEEKVEDDGGE